MICFGGRSEAAWAAGDKARGAFSVFGAAPLDDCERPHCVAIHVSRAQGRARARRADASPLSYREIMGFRVRRALQVGGVLQAAGVPAREEWIALQSDDERDAWCAPTRLARTPPNDRPRFIPLVF